jgi:hypothetical protein
LLILTRERIGQVVKEGEEGPQQSKVKGEDHETSIHCHIDLLDRLDRCMGRGAAHDGVLQPRRTEGIGRAGGGDILGDTIEHER